MKKYLVKINATESVELAAEKMECDPYRITFYAKGEPCAMFQSWLYWQQLSY